MDVWVADLTTVDCVSQIGIRRLLNDGTFLACFPLHEGRYDRAHSSGSVFDRRVSCKSFDCLSVCSCVCCNRNQRSILILFQVLYLTWARPSDWYKKQPLCLIRKYFGEKIALYFCWLGFYTNMLVYPAIVGTICFLYGLASINSEDNIPSKEICDAYGVGNITLCPLCDKACSYQRLSDSCLFARITYLFDNPSTVFFAIFMSFWGKYRLSDGPDFNFNEFQHFQQQHFWNCGNASNQSSCGNGIYKILKKMKKIAQNLKHQRKIIVQIQWQRKRNLMCQLGREFFDILLRPVWCCLW